MALKAKKPEKKDNRLKMLLYGNHGSGKSHFCCDIPRTYFIDTESIDQYSQFVDMLHSKDSAFVTMHDLSEVINEVVSLLKEKHDYRTLVIDSLSVLYTNMCNKEYDIVGDQYARNTAKPKRMLMHLADLLTRLDMNIIVTSHQKDKYESIGKDNIVSKVYDIPDKLGYMLGMVARADKIGPINKMNILKTRYKEFETNSWVEMSYKEISSRLGEELFSKESKVVALASPDQVAEIKNMVDVMKIDDAIVSKWLTKSKADSYEEMDSEQIQKCIEYLKNKIINKEI